MDRVLAECRRNLGRPPRSFSFWDRMTYLQARRPLWCVLRPDDLNYHFRMQRRLLEEGRVVWGHIVQANRVLFHPGSMNAPGEVVFSVDREPIDPADLADVAIRAGELKGTRPRHPGEAAIAEHLTDEYTRVFGLPLPPSISPGYRCELSTTFFVREHLPRRRLCTPLLPILISPTRRRAAMPLPSRYWPEDFAEWWQRG